jgi:hypothetical protein
MLTNPNNAPNAVFVPTAGGYFRRFNANTGRPMDAGPGDEHGLFDSGGRLHYGKLPSTMALDSANGLDPSSAGFRTPNSTSTFSPAPPLPPKSGALTGRPGETTADQGGGGQKISRSRAHKIWSMAKDKLSPSDLDQLTKMLKGIVDWSLPDEDEQGQAQDQPPDQPPSFAGQHLRGGGMVGDAALAAFNREWPQVAAIGRDNMGLPVPKTRYQREAEKARLALDERAGGESALEQFQREWPSIARIGRCY